MSQNNIGRILSFLVFGLLTFLVFVEGASASAFDLTSPANNTISIDQAPTLVWSPITEPNFENYTVQIDTVSTFASPDFQYERTAIVSNTTITIPDTLLSDQQYYWRVIAYNTSGDSLSSTNFFYYRTDNTKPLVTSISLTGHNSNYISPNADLTYDNLSVDLGFSESSTYSIYVTNSSSDLIRTLATGTSSDPSAVIWDGKNDASAVQSDGLYNIGVNLTDTAGNSNNSIIVGSVTIDNTNPTVNTVFPTTFDEDTATTVYATYSDSSSGINSCDLYVEGVLNSSMSLLNATHSNTSLNLATPGSYNVYANCSDNVNNYNNNPTVLTVSDTTAPTLVAAPVVTAGTTGDTVDIIINVTDNVDPNAGFIAYRKLGDIWTIAQMTELLEATNDVFNYTITVDSNNDTDLQYYVNITDAASNLYQNGNLASPNSITITDDDAPSPSDNSQSTATTGDNLTFNVSTTDNIAVDTVYVSYWYGGGSSSIINLDGTGDNYLGIITIQSDSLDTLQYSVNANDTSGNVAALTTTNVTITDNDVPTVSVVTGNTTGTTGDSVTINATLADNIGVENATLFYRESGAGNWSQTDISSGLANIAISSTSVNDVNYYVIVNDSAGNGPVGDPSTDGTVYYRITVTDDDEPGVLINNIVPADYNSNFTVNATVVDNIQVKNVSYRLENSTYESSWNLAALTDGYWVATFDISAIPDGNYSLRINATDTTDNSNSSQYVQNIVIDRVAPEIKEVLPVNASYTNDQVPVLRVNITDLGSGVNSSGLEMMINGFSVSPTVTAIENGFNLAYSTGPYGGSMEITAQVRAADNAGNKMEEFTWMFKVDITAPTVTDPSVDDTDSKVRSIDTLNLTVKATDDMAGVETVTAGLTNLEMQKVAVGVYNIITNITALGLSEGNQTLYFNATDNAGSVGSVGLDFIVDDTAAFVTSMVVNDSSLKKSDSFQINVTVTDLNFDNGIVTVANNALVSMQSAGSNVWTVITTPSALGCVAADVTCTLTFNAKDDVNNENNTETLTITIVNVVPVSSSIPTISWNEDTTTTVNLSEYFTDADGDDLSFIVTDVDSVTVAIDNATNIATLSSSANFYGIRYVTLNATDNLASTQSNNVTLVVNYLNDEGPVVSQLPTIVFNEDSFNDSINLDDYVVDSDTADANITWTKIGGDANILFNVTSDRKANFTATADFNGITSVVLQAYDGNNTAFNVFSVNVVAQNDAPSVPVLTLPENNSLENFTHVLLTWSASTQPSDETETVSYYVYNGNNADNLTLQAKTTSTQYNVTGLVDMQTYYWKVMATDDTLNSTATDVRKYTIQLNYAPNITSSYPVSNPNITETDSQLFNITQTDIDSEDTVTVSWYVDNVLNVSVIETFTLTTGFNDVGTHNVTVVVTDNSGAYDSKEWTVTVNNNNRVPVYNGTITDITWPEDSNGSVNLNTMFNDPDGESLTFDSTAVDKVTIYNTNGAMTLVPDQDFNGIRYVNFTATDGTNTIQSSQIMLNVTPVADAPQITSFTPTYSDPKISTTGTQAFTVITSDIDGTTPITTWYIDGTSQGTGNSFTYNASSAGTFNVTAVASDGTLSDLNEWALTVSAAPVANDYTGETTDFSAISNLSAATDVKIENISSGKIDFGSEAIDLTSSIDIDNHIVLTKNLIAVDSSVLPGFQNQNATITLKGLNYDKAPVIKYNVAFVTDVSQITGDCPDNICSNVNYNKATGVLTFTVTGFSSYSTEGNTTNTNPEITSTPSTSATENQQYTYNVEAVDADNDAFTFSLTQSPSGMNIDTTLGLIRWTSEYNQIGNNSVTVMVTDNQSGNDTQTFVVTVVEGPKLEIEDLDVKVDGDSDNNLNNGDTISEDVRPGSNVDVKIKVKNRFQKDQELEIEDIFITAILRDIDDGDDLEEETDEFDLKPQKSERETITFKIPQEVEEDTYELVITVEGEDENDTFHELEWTIYLEVKKDKHDIQINKAQLSRSNIELPGDVTLTINLINYGRDEEDEVTLEIVNHDLGINFRQSNIELSDDLFDDDSEFRKTVAMSFDDEVNAGTYPITVSVYYDDSKLDDETTVDLTIKEGKVVKTAVKKESVKQVTKTSDNVQSATQQVSDAQTTKKTTEARFSDSKLYAIILVLAFVIVLGMVVSMLGVLLLMKRRR